MACLDLMNRPRGAAVRTRPHHHRGAGGFWLSMRPGESWLASVKEPVIRHEPTTGQATELNKALGSTYALAGIGAWAAVQVRPESVSIIPWPKPLMSV